MALFYYEWFPVLFISWRGTQSCQWRHTISTDQQVAEMHQDLLQCAKKGREEEACKLLSMDLNSSGLKIFT